MEQESHGGAATRAFRSGGGRRSGRLARAKEGPRRIEVQMAGNSKARPREGGAAEKTGHLLKLSGIGEKTILRSRKKSLLSGIF